MNFYNIGLLFIEASKVSEENKRLQAEVEILKWQLDESKLKEEIRSLKAEVKMLRDSHQLYKQRAGEQKHIADMLQVKLDKLQKK